MVKWGILGCGKIANKFAECFSNNAIEDSSLVAAAARDLSRAQSFSKNYEIESSYSSYAELAKDPTVDAVYIATPHSHHKEHAMLCLENGKSVMCEKAFCINTEEAEEVIAMAKEKNLFLMEAMWMRFLPVMVHLRKLIDGGSLGAPIKLHADFSFKGNNDPSARLLNPHLAGGALLDVGIYPLSFSLMVFNQEPKNISSSADIGKTNIDESNEFKMEFSPGAVAVLTSSVVSEGQKNAVIEFENGQVDIPLFWRGESMTITKNGQKEELKFPFKVNGFEYEIQDSVNCIKEGKLESDTMPLSETLKTLAIMDKLREQWGLSYPMETKVS